MIGSHDSNQRGFIIKIMFCIKVSFFCEHETANMKIAFVCGHFTCHLKVIKLHDSFLYSCFVFKCIFQLFFFILQAHDELFLAYIVPTIKIHVFLFIVCKWLLFFELWFFEYFIYWVLIYLDHIVCIQILQIL